MVEKLSHKVRDVLDSSYDRYNRRLGYAEERIEMALKKVQVQGSQKLKYLKYQIFYHIESSKKLTNCYDQ